jgi:hypothetical protein
VNDERTRTFLALEIPSALDAHAHAHAPNEAPRVEADAAEEEAARAVEALRRGVAAVDAAFALVGLPPFHAAPRPHVSLAWALGDVADDVAAAARAAARAGAAPPAHWRPRARVVRVMIGQRVIDVWRRSGDGGAEDDD